MIYSVIKLTFDGPIHLSKGSGSYETGEEILHSDTIKSALFAAAIQVNQSIHSDGETNLFLDSFRVSSAFPFYKEEYFFPKPSCKSHKIYDEFGRYVKKAGKKLKFIGKSFFEDVLTGQNLETKHIVIKDHLLYEDAARHEPSMASESISSEERDRPNFYIFRRDTAMKVVVPRYSDGETEPEPYYIERTYFSQDAGLYFFIQWPTDPKNIQIIESALDTLSENGLGMDRNTGNGQFKWEKSEIDLNTPEQGSHRVFLSLYCPASKEEVPANILENSTYALIKRGGYISNGADENTLSYRKKSIYMMTEGSVLEGTTANNFIGKLLDLRPEIMGNSHPIWRDGRPFTLPCNPQF
jgi:CRISPR-associated protein Csm4